VLTTQPSFGAVLAPVVFAYGGWQSSCFVATEMRAPRRDLPRALLLGVSSVIVLYLAVNYVCLRVLGIEALAHIATPASAVMEHAFGRRGSILIALGIAVSALGFLSQSILTAPRVYFAMAEDGLFFRAVAWVHPVTRVPVIAVLVQGAFAIAIAVSGRYEQILDFMVPVDALFYALTGTCLFVLRKRATAEEEASAFHMPAPRAVCGFFVLAFAVLAVAMVAASPRRALLGLAIVLAGMPVYALWSRRRPSPPAA
jgi:APA family basic amino acid/polyamine antiporter